jgi:hypothetical protein
MIQRTPSSGETRIISFRQFAHDETIYKTVEAPMSLCRKQDDAPVEIDWPPINDQYPSFVDKDYGEISMRFPGFIDVNIIAPFPLVLSVDDCQGTRIHPDFVQVAGQSGRPGYRIVFEEVNEDEESSMQEGLR